MDMKPSLRTTLDALARAGRPLGAALPATTPALAAAQPAGSAPHGALPSQASAGAGDWDDVVAKLNAERGLQAGANMGGPGMVAASQPVTRVNAAATPDELADQVNAAHGLRPGANISPEMIAHFSEGAV
ncbi:hypothetical protein [Methylobacterium sp. GC_Met_2]|uniref:hypothetical protein n=1 Tax=Methylobacterium sp. GC_Met_2 TaxID=2937376 RepID=UPI00226B0DC8|nr:hypothetical protein [Methylobacterium sp. GC_Met_2]